MKEYMEEPETRTLYPEPPLTYIKNLLDGEVVKVLILNGDLDYYVNYIGQEKILSELEWKNQE